MIEHEGQKYYSISELKTMICEPISQKEQELSDLWCKVYDIKTYCIYVQYVESKIYPAIEKKLIRHIEYKNKGKKTSHRVFTIEDVITFLKRPEAKKVMTKQRVITDLKVVDPV